MAKKRKSKSAAERDLDEGLLETFPGSDAVAAVEPAPKEPRTPKPARKRRKPARRKPR